MGKTKAQKKRERAKRLRKERNVQRNRPKYKYKLEVLEEDGSWSVVMGFRSAVEVNDHVARHEEMRRNNTTDIIEGRIISLGTGRQVAHIPPHKVKDPALFERSTVPEDRMPGDTSGHPGSKVIPKVKPKKKVKK